jgi:hypothetical protein
LTPNAPTYEEIEQFLQIDNWQCVPSTARGGHQQKHIFFTKWLDSGELLETHISHSRDKSPGPDTFSAILREQLKVSKLEFWNALRSSNAVDRPVDLDSAEAAEKPMWAVDRLLRVEHMCEDEIVHLSNDELARLAQESFNRPRH